MRQRSPSTGQRPGQLRIIGGQWRSRRLPVPEGPGLRPTPDRIRETLYNWLTPHIEGARVLDPFTGSGALLLEALSRGADSALALDTQATAVDGLRAHLNTLHCDRAQVYRSDALSYLSTAAEQPFDIVLLDPPFHQQLLTRTCVLLERHGWLSERAWIYTESETPPSQLELPENWRLHREKRAGQVHYALWQRHSPSE